MKHPSNVTLTPARDSSASGAGSLADPSPTYCRLPRRFAGILELEPAALLRNAVGHDRHSMCLACHR